MTQTLATYASKSQALDQSFPQRLLLNALDGLPTDELKSRMGGLEEKRARLKGIGLLEDTATNPFDTAELDKLDDTQRRAITLYVRDTEDKLGVLDDLARRIELLRDTVNGKFQNKSIRFGRDRGITAAGRNAQPLGLEALSSGEQHELVLLCTVRWPSRQAPMSNVTTATTLGPNAPRGTPAGSRPRVTCPQSRHAKACKANWSTHGLLSGMVKTWCNCGAGSRPRSLAVQHSHCSGTQS